MAQVQIDVIANVDDAKGKLEGLNSTLGQTSGATQDMADTAAKAGVNFNDVSGKLDDYITMLQSATPENLAFAMSFEEITNDFDTGKISSQEATVQLEDLKQKMQEAGGATKDLNGGMGDLKDGLGGAIEKLTGLNVQNLSVAGGLAALGALVKSSVDDFMSLGETIKTVSIISGASQEDVAKLIASMGLLGISSGTVQTAMDFAIRKGFQPTVENLMAMSDQFNAMTDPVAKGQLLISTFGRSAGPELADYMSKGSAGIQELIGKAVKIGDVMSTQDVAAAEKYKETLGEFNATIDATKKQIVEGLIPVLDGGLFKTMLKVNDQINNGSAAWTAHIPIIASVVNMYYLAAAGVDAYNKNIEKNIDLNANKKNIDLNLNNLAALYAAADKQREAASAHANSLREEQQALDHVKISTDALTMDQIIANEATRVATIEAGHYAAGLSGTMGTANDTFSKQLVDLKTQSGDLWTQIAALDKLSYLSPAQQTQLDSLRTQYGEVNSTIALSGSAFDLATDKIIYDMSLQEIKSAETSGQMSHAQAKAATDSVNSWAVADGMIDSSSAMAYDNIQGYINYTVSQGQGAIMSFADWMKANPGTWMIDVVANFANFQKQTAGYGGTSGNGGGVPGYGGTPTGTDAGTTTPPPLPKNSHAFGGGYVIPGGYNENWPIGGGHTASSGEEVKVIPPGQTTNNSPTINQVLNFYGPANPAQVKQAASDGLLDGMRAGGLR